jgi:nitrogen fixation NifU-like protein
VFDDAEEDADRLNVLAGVREFPVRVKCATLAWHTMHAAMSGDAAISTE